MKEMIYTWIRLLIDPEFILSLIALLAIIALLHP